MSLTTVGTCGICGGAVCIPTLWMGINPPKPQCTSCGAIPKEAHGPVLDMQIRVPIPSEAEAKLIVQEIITKGNL